MLIRPKGLVPNFMSVVKYATLRYFAAVLSAYENRSFTTKSASKPTNRKWTKSSLSKTKDPKKRSFRVVWTDEQKKVLCAVNEGKSVFVTGAAGTGKTLFLKEIIKRLKKMHGPSYVFVTASTGIAACSIEGQTLHSFAGIRQGVGDYEELLSMVLENWWACRSWKKVRALVVDEISMVEGDLFDKLEKLAKNIKEVDAVWGGIQLFVTGDFHQLPPVPNQGSPPPKYAFEADSWNSSFHLQITFTKIFRQSDPWMIKLLLGIRKGQCNPEDIELLVKYCSRTEPDPSSVRIYPRKKDVERDNNVELRRLQKEIVVYKAIDSGQQSWKWQLKSGISQDELSLCEGARVMLIKNLNVHRGLVNGTTGTVVGFVESDKNPDGLCSEKLLPIVKFDSGEIMKIKPEKWSIKVGDDTVAHRKQIPLILAWAVTVHKCQGMTLDKVHTDLSRAFGCGMIYTAISRTPTIEGLGMSGFSPSKIMVDPKVAEFYSWFDEHKEFRDDSVNSIEDVGGHVGVSGKTNTSEPKLGFSLSKYLASLKRV